MTFPSFLQTVLLSCTTQLNTISRSSKLNLQLRRSIRKICCTSWRSERLGVCLRRNVMAKLWQLFKKTFKHWTTRLFPTINGWNLSVMLKSWWKCLRRTCKWKRTSRRQTKFLRTFKRSLRSQRQRKSLNVSLATLWRLITAKKREDSQRQEVTSS